MSLTNKGLVEYAKKALALGNDSIYVYGAFGQELSESLINQKAKQYLYNLPRKGKYKKCLDSAGREYAFDCVGLIKAYLWGGHGNVKYNASQDKSANGMLSASKVKGKINTIPETPGLLVHMSGHIGIYIGGGYVIECTPNTTFAKQDHKAGGVCKTKLSARKWTSWCECPYITYEKETSKPATSKPMSKYIQNSRVKSWQVVMNKVYRCGLSQDGSFGPDSQAKANKYQLYKKKTIASRMRNDYVRWLQNRLKELGYKIAVDGSFWNDTDKIVKQFQKDKGLKVDGYVGTNTVKELLR